MDLASRIEGIIGQTVNDMGFAIVRVRLLGNQDLRLQIMAEPQDGRSMTVDNCAKISRAVSAVLDVEALINSHYILEVSSPGLDRPLVRIADFKRFTGSEVKVETSRLIDGRKRFRGRLMGVENDLVKVLVDGSEMGFPHANIHRAKLLLTNEPLAASKEQRKQ